MRIVQFTGLKGQGLSTAIAQAAQNTQAFFAHNGLYIRTNTATCEHYCAVAASSCSDHDARASVYGCPSQQSAKSGKKAKRAKTDWDLEIAWVRNASSKLPTRGSVVWLLVINIGTAYGGCCYAGVGAIDDQEIASKPMIVAHELGHVFGLSDDPMVTSFMWSAAPKSSMTTPQRQSMLGRFPALGTLP